MDLSIFNSKSMKASHGLVCLAAAIALYFLALEIVMRTVVPRISQVERRHIMDRQAASTLARAGQDNVKSVLVVGNSLLQQGIDRPLLANTTAPKHRVVVYPVENTTYWDWYFGLRRLLREGAAPDVVVLCLNLRQALADTTNGEGFAHSLMWIGDLVSVTKASNLDLTGASNYFFANISAWLGGRSFIRNWVLEKWVPDANTLVQYFAPAGPGRSSQDSRAEKSRVLLQRLGALRDLCEAAGTHFVFLIPPSASGEDVTTEIQQLAAQAGILVMVPFRAGELDASAFSDGFHLSADGAKRFTARFAHSIADNELASPGVGKN